MHDLGVTGEECINLILIKEELVNLIESFREPTQWRTFLELAQLNKELLSEKDTFEVSGDSKIIAMLARLGG